MPSGHERDTMRRKQGAAALLLAGAGLCSGGTGMIHLPSGLIVAGAFCLLLAVRAAR